VVAPDHGLGRLDSRAVKGHIAEHETDDQTSQAKPSTKKGVADGARAGPQPAADLAAYRRAIVR
jgi:hypothetical protein